jgi:hypothetical protein
VRPAVRGVFPLLLPAVRGQVEQVEVEPQPVDAAPGREVGAEDLIPVAQECVEEINPPSALTSVLTSGYSSRSYQ